MSVELGMPQPGSPGPRVPHAPDGTPVSWTDERFAEGLLHDTYGRVATDLRVSLTDRCNLRCTYCMPAEGLDWMATDKVLTAGEISRLLRIGVEELGIGRIRFTGGEPLLRREPTETVRAAARPDPRRGRARSTAGP